MSRWRSPGSLDRPSGLELVLIRSFPRCLTPMCQTLSIICVQQDIQHATISVSVYLLGILFLLNRGQKSCIALI